MMLDLLLLWCALLVCLLLLIKLPGSYFAGDCRVAAGSLVDPGLLGAAEVKDSVPQPYKQLVNVFGVDIWVTFLG